MPIQNRVVRRPRRSAGLPALRAPIIVPIKALEVVNPCQKSLSPHSVCRAPSAPEMTAVSNPNRSPPNAATSALPIKYVLKRGSLFITHFSPARYLHLSASGQRSPFRHANDQSPCNVAELRSAAYDASAEGWNEGRWGDGNGSRSVRKCSTCRRLGCAEGSNHEPTNTPGEEKIGSRGILKGRTRRLPVKAFGFALANLASGIASTTCRQFPLSVAPGSWPRLRMLG